MSRELIEAIKGQKEFATLGKLKSFQYVSGIPGMAYNPFVNEEAREAYFDYEQVIVLNFWVERIKETGMLMVEQPKLGIILEERVVEPSVPELKGQVSFDCGSWDGPLKTSLVTMWELMKPSWCPHPNAGLIWDMTADITLDLDDDASLHDLAMIHHLLAMRLTKRKSNPSTELSEEGPSSNWLKQGTCLAQHSGMEGHVCNLGHCLVTLSEQHRQLARLYGRLSISDKSGMELVADCHGVTDVNLITALGFCSMTSSIESLERLERAHELVTSLSVEIFPGALQTEQKIGGWREALENEMNLKDSEAYHKPTGSKYLVGSNSAPYCSSRYPTHMVVMDARTQQVLIDQLFSVPKCVRLARMSERSHDLLAKIFQAVPKRSEGELQDVVGEEFLRLNEGNVSEFQKQKASGALPTEFPTIEEKDDLHRILMEVEPLLGASGYRTRRNIVRTHGEYPCHCLAQTLGYPKRGNLMLVWDVEELYSTGLPDQNQQVSIVVVSAMLAVRWLEANADTSEQETAVPTPEQLSNVKMSHELDLFRTTCSLAQHSGMEGHVCNLGHCLVTLSEQHRQLARLYGRLSISDKSGMELVADCHGVTDVNLITALGFCSMTSSIESLERLERAHELVTSLSVEIFPGALQTEQKIGGWREALENEMNLKDSEAYHKPTGSKYLVGSNSAPYCSSRYPTHMVVMDARTQQVLIDQLFSVPKCVRLARMSERSHDLLAKIFQAVPKRSEGELQDVVGEEFLRLNEGNVSEFQKQKASGALPTEFPTIEEKDDLHRILMEVEPLLGASGYRTRRNIVRTHGEYPCHCLAQTLGYPKRGNLMLVWDVEELYSTGLPDQNQQVSIVVVSAMLAVRWLEANADTSEQETAVPTPEQLSNVKMSHELDLFRTTCKVLRIPKAIERIWSRQRLMPWFRAVMTSWMYERAKRHMSRNTEAYQSFQLDIGPGAYKRAFLTHRNAVTTAVKRVAGAPCVTEDERKEVLRADLERNVSLCLHNSFCRNREQKVNVDLLPCCKPRLLEQESWGTARNSMDMLEKVLEDSEADDQDGEVNKE